MQSVKQDVQESLWLGAASASASKPLSNFAEWKFHTDDLPAIQTTDGRKMLTYQALRRQVDTAPAELKGRVALVLEQSQAAELAILLLSVMRRCGTACPLDPKLPQDHFRAALRQLRCRLLVMGDHCAAAAAAAKEEAVTVLEVNPDDACCGTFKWMELPTGLANMGADGGDEAALLLRTSGTTATPKVVPITLSNLHHGAVTIAASLNLMRSDICLNAMPFFHIGGIACNLLAVLSAGSSVTCMPAFDAAEFVSQLGGEPKPTWYYAVPTMHKALLLYLQATAESNSGKYDGLLGINLRFVRSGAAHLPHNDAIGLSVALGCPVLPTYSMTECMPVCSTALGWRLEEKDTVGAPIGVSLRIADEYGCSMAFGEQGEVHIQGPALMSGYEGVSRNATFVDGWFRTGDLGKMDLDGRVYLLGRKREMIKRGGEQISLHEVDNAVAGNPAVHTCVSFAVANEFWGEEVAAAIVLKPGFSQDVERILKSVQCVLEDYKVPKQLIVVRETDLPKTASGKYIRNGLAKHLGVECVDNGALRALAGMRVGCATDAYAPQPSKALQGLRACLMLFVMFHHIGDMPGRGLKQVQNFSISMPAFVFIAGFSSASSTSQELSFEEWPDFYATRIGTGQSMNFISTAIALVRYFIFSHFPWRRRLWNMSGDTVRCLIYGHSFFNSVSWFQTTFYVLVLTFPLIDRVLRKMSLLALRLIAGSMCFVGAIQTPVILYMQRSRNLPGLVVYIALYLPFCWLSYFISGVSAWYIFKAHSYHPMSRWRHWGTLTDALSIMWLSVCVLVFFDRCTPFRYNMLDIRCSDEVYNAWVAENEKSQITMRRFPSLIGYFFGYCRLSFPLLYIWLYGLAVGQGFSGRLFSSRVLVQHLSPLSFPVYLMHMQVAWLWHYALHGAIHLKPVINGSGYLMQPKLPEPIPVSWQEFFIVSLLTVAVSWMLNEYVAGHVTPVVVGWYRWVFTCCRRRAVLRTGASGSTVEDVLLVVRQLTGTRAGLEARLDEIGLDSFGATALLSMLRSTHPRAALLRQASFYELGTIQALGSFLEGPSAVGKKVEVANADAKSRDASDKKDN